MLESPSRIDERPRILGDLKSLIDSLPAAVRAQAIADIRFVLAAIRQQLSEDCRPQESSALVRKSNEGR